LAIHFDVSFDFGYRFLQFVEKLSPQFSISAAPADEIENCDFPKENERNAGKLKKNETSIFFFFCFF